MDVEEASAEIARLKSLLAHKDEEIARLKSELAITQSSLTLSKDSIAIKEIPCGQPQERDLTKEDISRYSRQLLLSQVGAEGQKRLKNSAVLIVGAGGLGCPASIYLAAAGIGHLGVIDYDVVEISNLHRQILHQEAGVGTSKAQSLARAVRRLNSTVRVTVHEEQLDRSNAMSILASGPYDLVLDCSDNPATRYLINDACVLAGLPLISGSALRWEGQLTIYNYRGGPCYRCIYPSPPDPKFVTNCSDGGVIGAVPGLIGTLQAMEAIKLLLSSTTRMASSNDDDRWGPSYSQRLLIFDGESGLFRNVRLRGRQPNCAVCSDRSDGIHRLEDFDYTLFCGRGPNDKETGLRVLSSEDRVTAVQFHQEHLQAKQQQQVVSSCSSGTKDDDYLLIDVRPELETSICRLPGSLNFPYRELEKRADELKDLIRERLPKEGGASGGASGTAARPALPVFVVCRRGNNSQLAVQKIRGFLPADWPVVVRDIVGGITAWAEQVDPDFPVY